MAQLTYPGVYIEEFKPAAPIAGVGTSTAAFIGAAANGPVMKPRLITSWKAFLDEFAASDGMPPQGSYYLWYAVRGFFENGGAGCYVVRVSSATYDTADFDDQLTPKAGRALTVRAREVGSQTPAIGVEITTADVLASTAKPVLFRPEASIDRSGTDFLDVKTVEEARQFVRGDEITWTQIDSKEKTPIVVDRVEEKRIFLDKALVASYTTGTIRLADLAKGRSVAFRLEEGGEFLGAGSVVKLVQVGNATLQPPAPAVDVTAVVRSVQQERIPATVSQPGFTTYRITLREKLTSDIRLEKQANATTVSSPVFTMVVTRAATATEPAVTHTYPDLSVDPLHPRYFASVVTAHEERIVEVSADPPSVSTSPLNQPAAKKQNLSGGAADDLSKLNLSHYQQALGALDTIDDVNFIAIPDRQDVDVQGALLADCERLQDRFAIFDSRPGLPMSGPGSVVTQRNSLDSARGYGALYYPWLDVPHASGTGRILVPPSGHVAGIYSRTDQSRGVHKAPAGEEATVSGAIGVAQPMSDIDQGQLNVKGINVIRTFRPGGRPVVWGARTTATDTVWQYVSIRRLFLYLEESIQEGIDWAVFEPNNLQLWQGLKRTITAFLTQSWREGALFGETPDRAFYVRIDEDLNPFTEQALGRLHIEIGVRPSYPAEFIVVRIGIWDGGSEVTE
jgi:phage tail sheath protein FI